VARYEVDEIDLRDPDGDVDVDANMSVSSRKPNPKNETSRSRSISIFSMGRFDDPTMLMSTCPRRRAPWVDLGSIKEDATMEKF
jgi:hypothetical protein